MQDKLNILKLDRIVMSDKYGDWCQLPYPGHPKGCPNYNKKITCPPNANKILKRRNTNYYFVYSIFDLQAHVDKMHKKHPDWSERQLRNVYYWQNTSRKYLVLEVVKAISRKELKIVTYCPEGHGVNVYATCAINGLKLERIKGLKICRHIALLRSV